MSETVWDKGETKMPMCPLCDIKVESLNHDITHTVMEFIKERHPEWVEDTGACQKCVTYFEEFDKSVKVIYPDKED